MDNIAPLVGLLGLVGLAGLAGFKSPTDKSRPGGAIRLMGLLGFAGLAGFWIPGTGASGAFGALGLWNHQNPKLAFWGKLGPLGITGLPYLVLAIIG